MTTDKPAVQTRDVAVAEAEAQSSGFARSVARPERGPLAQLADAIIREGNLEKVKQLIDLQRELRDDAAREAYVRSMAAFRAEVGEIAKRGKANIQHRQDKGGGSNKYSFPKLADVLAVAVPALSRYGLAHNWTTEQGQHGITVTCTISHEAGHERSTSLTAGPDQTGNKNAIQAVGSTVSYLERYTFMALAGLAGSDQDNDALTGEASAVITPQQAETITGLITESGADETAFLAWVLGENAEGKKVADIPRDRFDDCCRELNRKKRAQK